MARLGSFDPDLVPVENADINALSSGWVDRDVVPFPAAPPPPPPPPAPGRAVFGTLKGGGGGENIVEIIGNPVASPLFTMSWPVDIAGSGVDLDSQDLDRLHRLFQVDDGTGGMVSPSPRQAQGGAQPGQPSGQRVAGKPGEFFVVEKDVFVHGIPGAKETVVVVAPSPDPLIIMKAKPFTTLQKTGLALVGAAILAVGIAIGSSLAEEGGVLGPRPRPKPAPKPASKPTLKPVKPSTPRPGRTKPRIRPRSRS